MLLNFLDCMSGFSSFLFIEKFSEIPYRLIISRLIQIVNLVQ